MTLARCDCEIVSVTK